MIKVETTPFGTADDQAITLFTLTNAAGMQVGIINYGGIVQSLRVPDAKGAIDDVVLGFDTLAEYTGGNIAYFGALCGRVANRITAGRFTLAGRDYTLAANNAPNSLHGGLKGYDKRVWEATATADGVRLTLESADGEEGYPGTLSISRTLRRCSRAGRPLRHRSTEIPETAARMRQRWFCRSVPRTRPALPRRRQSDRNGTHHQPRCRR